MSQVRPQMRGNQLQGINQIAYSQDGQTVAISDVHLWVETRREGQVLSERSYASRSEKVRSTERVRGLAFSPDGEALYVAAGENVHAVDVSTGTDRWVYQAPRFLGFLIISPMAIATSSSGLIAGAFDNGSVTVWEPNGSLRRRWHHNDSPRAIAFLPAGDQLAGTDGFSVSVWDTSSGRQVWRAPLKSTAYGLAVSPLDGTVATRRIDNVDLRDPSTGSIIGSLPGSIGLPLVVFRPTHQEVAVASAHDIKVFAYDGKELDRIPVTDTRVVSMVYKPDGKQLVVGCSNREMRTLDLR